MNCMSLWLDYDDPRLFGIAKGHGAVVCRKADGWRIDADTPEQLRDILNDYCRVKVAMACADLEEGCSVAAGSLATDAFYAEVEARRTAQERRP